MAGCWVLTRCAGNRRSTALKRPAYKRMSDSMLLQIPASGAF